LAAAVSDADLKDVGWEPKLGDSDEQRMLRARVFNALGYDARDPEVLAWARRIADKALDNPGLSRSGTCTQRCFRLAALTGDETFYDKLLTGLKSPKSPGRILHVALHAAAL
jgi:cytosol alanyl aminopeptidase